MSTPRMKLSWYEPLQQVANHLDFSITHAIQILYREEKVFRNSYPQSRLIFVEETKGGTGGTIEVFDGGTVVETIPIRPKTLLFFPPNLDLRFNYKIGLSCIGIHFNLSLVPGIDIFDGQKATRIIPWRDTENLKRLHAAIWNKNSLKELLWTKGFLLSVASNFVDSDDISRHLAAMRFSQKYAQILDHINANPRINVDPEPIARQFNLTYESFKRNFKRDAGITLHAWIARRVAREAGRALAETDESVKSISARFGFSGAIYFHRFIKKHFGDSPTKYRELHRAK